MTKTLTSFFFYVTLIFMRNKTWKSLYSALKTEKYKELLRYILVGIATTGINLFFYFFCCHILNIYYLISNCIAWTIGVIFAFFANQTLVFRLSESSVGETWKKFFVFSFFRLFSGFVETILLFLGVDFLNINDFLVKVFACVITTLLNYFFSKWVVFKKNKVE